MKKKNKNKKIPLKYPHIKAKIIGITLITIGLVFLLRFSSHYINIGFSLIFIGSFFIIMITEKTIPQNISNAQIEGNIIAVNQFIKELNLKGNALFIPKSDILSQEKIFIPLQNSNIILPEIDDNMVFSTGNDQKSLGIFLPASGQKLLDEIGKDFDLENINQDNIESKLQLFVGMNVFKSLSLKKNNDKYKLEVNNPEYCFNNPIICKQYPCPSCSAILLAITRLFKEKIKINDILNNGKKTSFYFSRES